MQKIKEAELLDELFYQHHTSSISFLRPKFLKLIPKTLSHQKTKRLSILRFSQENEEEDPKHAFKLLNQVLRFHKNTQKLFLALPTNSTDQDLVQIANGLKGLKGLQEIAIEIRSLNGITDKGFSWFIKRLARFHLLKSFSLELYWSEKISDVSLGSLGRMFKKMVFLKEIRLLFFNMVQFTDKGVERVNLSLNCLPRLEDFSIKIKECHQITGGSLVLLTSGQPLSLKKLCLDFGDCRRLNDVGMYLMTKDLEELENLQSLKLKFWNCPKLSNNSLYCIWKMMNKLPSLRRVTLQFSGSDRFTDEGLNDMNKKLEWLALMEKFSIEFFGCLGITNDGVAWLCEALERGVSLRNLSVYFGACDKITDFGVSKVIDLLLKLTHLRKVGVDFSANENITDMSLGEISEFLGLRVGELEKIRIGMVGMEGTTKRGKDAFVKEIEKLMVKRPSLMIKHRR